MQVSVERELRGQGVEVLALSVRQLLLGGDDERPLLEELGQGPADGGTEGLLRGPAQVPLEGDQQLVLGPKLQGEEATPPTREGRPPLLGGVHGSPPLPLSWSER